jgi:rhomboid-like protein
MYEQLPSTYRDSDGLQFSNNDIPPQEVDRIFANTLKPETANALLRILHGRRVAGTLDDPTLETNTAYFTSEQKEAALKHLRATIPVDETMNAGLRAQDELAEIEKQLHAKEEGTQDKPAEEDVYKPDPIYGYSHMEAMRAAFKAKMEARRKRDEEERKQKGEPVAGTLEAYQETGAVSPRMEKWLQDGMLSQETEPPTLKTFDRLAGPVTLTGFILAALVGFAFIYEPPEHEYRFFPDASPGAALVGTLIGANLMIYFLWRFPPLWRFLNANFVVVTAMPKAPSVVGAVFSHQRFMHLFTNMAVLALAGPRLHDDIGRANFLAVYIGSGALGYVANLVFNPLHACSLGASGAVTGVLAAYFWLHRWDTFRILGWPQPPEQGAQGIAFLAALILWRALEGFFIPARLAAATAAAPVADVASHLGGLFGALGILVFLEKAAKTVTGFEDGFRKTDGETRNSQQTIREAELPAIPQEDTKGTITSVGEDDAR